MTIDFTPGPYDFHECGFEPNKYYILNTHEGGTHRGWLASVQLNGELMPEKQVANMNLLTAAPDLFKALKDMLEWGRAYTRPGDQNSPHLLLIAAVEAIKKAEGESS